MREENKLKKAIKQDGVDTQSDVLDELKRRYPQYVGQSDNKHAPEKKKRVAVFSALAAAAVCVAIIVPCAVLLPARDNGGDNDGSGNIRYCTQDEYSRTDGVDYTIGEYRANNKLNFLYFDWYEFGEDLNTSCYVSNSDNEVLCLIEQAYLPQTDEVVEFSITRANVYLSAFDSSIERCDGVQSVDNHAVKWVVNGDGALCVFEDGEYRYFIKILQGQNENRLIKLVEKLLETK